MPVGRACRNAHPYSAAAAANCVPRWCSASCRSRVEQPIKQSDKHTRLRIARDPAICACDGGRWGRAVERAARINERDSAMNRAAGTPLSETSAITKPNNDDRSRTAHAAGTARRSAELDVDMPVIIKIAADGVSRAPGRRDVPAADLGIGIRATMRPGYRGRRESAGQGAPARRLAGPARHSRWRRGLTCDARGDHRLAHRSRLAAQIAIEQQHTQHRGARGKRQRQQRTGRAVAGHLRQLGRSRSSSIIIS